MNNQNSSSVTTQASITAKVSNGQSEILQAQITEEKIQDWLIAYLAELLDIEQDEVDTKTPFERYGLDSSAVAGLVGDMETWLNKKLSPTLLYDYPNIEALAKFLANTKNTSH